MFADLYRLADAAKAELKEQAKDIGKLLSVDTSDWYSVDSCVSSIVNQAVLIKTIAQYMIDNADKFLENGPYKGQTARLTPIESEQAEQIVIEALKNTGEEYNLKRLIQAIDRLSNTIEVFWRNARANVGV